MNLGPKGFDKRFADYFVICGLDITSGLEPDQLSGDKLHCTPLDRPYRSKVLAHYPDNVPWNPFDEKAVGMLCHPRGLSFRTQKHTHGPLFHSFIITREDGTRTYGHTLTFYEEVRDRQICAAMQTLQAMHLTELSSSKTQTALVNNDSGSSHSLPRSFKLGSRQHTAKDSLYDVIRDTLYVTKCICLITQLPIILACRRFLEGLYSLVVSQEPPSLPLECYVYNILYEVPLPPPGRSLKFSCFGQSVMCQRPGAGELPLFEYSLQELFSTLGVANVVQLFSCVLLENQVLLCSKEYHKLMLVAESITTLLFPFSWQHVYVPILPASLQHFLDAPVPYIMGLQHSTEDKSQLGIPGEANLCFVDIDSLTMDVPEDTPKLPYMSNLIAEICDIFDTFGIPQPPEGVDRNLNQRGFYRQQHARKLSWSFESGDSGMSSSGSSARSSYSSLASTHSHIFQQSEALQRVTAIARRTGKPLHAEKVFV